MFPEITALQVSNPNEVFNSPPFNPCVVGSFTDESKQDTRDLSATLKALYSVLAKPQDGGGNLPPIEAQPIPNDGDIEIGLPPEDEKELNRLLSEVINALKDYFDKLSEVFPGGDTVNG